MRMEWGHMELEGGLCRVRAGRMWKDLVEEKMMGDCGKGTRIIYLYNLLLFRTDFLCAFLRGRLGKGRINGRNTSKRRK